MKNTYTEVNLEDILTDMVSYVYANTTQEERINYIKELAQTGLFHDAIGKVVVIKNNKIIVEDEY